MAQVHSIVSIVYFPQSMLYNLHRIMSYTPCKIGIISLLRLELNISEKRLQLERISGLVELVPSSTLVLDKAPICIDKTLGPAQNREYTPPEMSFNLIQCFHKRNLAMQTWRSNALQWETFHALKKK